MSRWVRPSSRVLFAAAVCFGMAGVARAAREFPDTAYANPADDAQQKEVESLVGHPAPPLQVTDWVGKPVTPADMKGRVVVIDIWATWCVQCLANVPHHNELQKKFGKDGLLVVGVCSSDEGQEEMAAVVKSRKIEYPTAKDPEEKTVKAYKVGFYPTYVVIDRQGKVRAAGVTSEALDEIVKKLLAEKAAV